LGVLGGGALWWQNMTMGPLRTEVALLRGREAQLGELRAEQTRLAALQVPPAELENLRRDRRAVERLRAEVDALRAKVEKPFPPAAAENAATDRLSLGRLVTSAEWKNVGATTPPAALETALWAAAGGDVDAFASLLSFDAAARKGAQALLDSLPAETRAHYGSPERLVAFLSIKDVPLGSAQVRRWSDTADGKVSLATVTLSGPDGSAKDVTLPLIRQDAAWKLYVIERTVARYQTMLKGSGSAK